MWVRGLKQKSSWLYYPYGVAPYVGAWIETYYQMQITKTDSVAPYVGAWIETSLYQV